MSGWTVETLYVHLYRVIDELDRRIGVALKSVESAASAAVASSDKATSKAEASANERFSLLNELKNMMTARDASLITRVEVDTRMSTAEKAVEGLTSRMDRMEAKGLGAKDTEKVRKDSAGLWVALLAALCAFGAMVFGALEVFMVYRKGGL